MMLPIVRPHFPKLGLFAADFNRALQTGQVTNDGTHVQEFERALTSILGAPTLCFSSGMAALVTMLMASDVDGFDVICPSFTFAATPHAIKLAGATPVFADIDPATLCLDPVDVERRLTTRTAAVMPVDPYGICFDVPKDWTDIDVLIDSAPSFGSTINGSHAPRGHAQIYSFHATKPFSTMEGGAMVSTNSVLMERARQIRNFGQHDNHETRIIGFNGKMMEVCALIGLHQLETWEYRRNARIESASRLRYALEGIEGLRVQHNPLGHEPVWTYRPVFIEPEFGKSRDAVAAALQERGIGVRKYYGACHLEPAYKHSTYPFLRATELLASQVISLPVYDEILDSEIKMIADAFKDIRNG